MKKPLHTKPGTTKKNNTGTWRTFKPVVDHDRCIACGICSRVCPEGCIFPVGDKLLQKKGKVFFEHDLDYCKGCGICAQECPVKCIKMVREEKESKEKSNKKTK